MHCSVPLLSAHVDMLQQVNKLQFEVLYLALQVKIICEDVSMKVMGIVHEVQAYGNSDKRPKK